MIPNPSPANTSQTQTTHTTHAADGRSSIVVERKTLEQAAQNGLLATQQVETLWVFLQKQQTAYTYSQSDENEQRALADAAGARFNFTHILYYLGGMIAIAAMSLFMTLSVEAFGGFGLTTLAVLYGVGLFYVAKYLEERKHIVPTGILATIIIVLIPLAVYGVQNGLGLWEGSSREYHEYHQYIDWRWWAMEIATLVGGGVLFWRFRYPFMLMPIAVTLWYMSMDLVPIFVEDNDWDARKWVSVLWGLATLLLTFRVDLRSSFKNNRDYAFWPYLSGLLAFSGGLSMMNSGSALGKLIYCLIHVGLILCGGVLARRTFVVFGGFGVTGYLGYLAYDVFKDSLLFTFALSGIGLVIIYAGILWQKHEKRISASLRNLIPEGTQLRKMFDDRHA